MSAAIEASAAGKRFGRAWALRDCTLSVPQGRVVGLVGTNGAGKSTLLHLAVGLLRPTEGHLTVLGERPGNDARQLGRVGFLAQDVPLYSGLTVDDHLRIGAALNPAWDGTVARARVDRAGLDRRQRTGGLSGGQRAQLALALAIGKRPELLILDEPVASLDPLARREFLADLMELAADGLSIVLSSHLLEDVERICDHVIVLAAGQVRVAGDVDELLASHKVLTGVRRHADLPADQTVIRQRHSERQSTLLVRTARPVLDPSWTVSDVGLEELVLAYMATPPPVTDVVPGLRSVS
ncbi:MAG: ABC transporter ATP-binding protein [Ilumatobacteraceae bacterium]